MPYSFDPGDTYRHLALHHADHFGNQVTVFEHLEKYLRRDIIREIADNVNTLRKLLRQVHPQKIALHQPGGKPGKILVQVNDAFGIDLGAVKRYIFSLKQETGQNARAAPHLEHRRAPVGCQAAGNAPGDGLVGQEMLA